VDRRAAITFFTAALVAARSSASGSKSFKTHWKVGWQQGLDACLLLGVLSTPSMQSEAYPEENHYWSEKLSPATRDALAHVRKLIDAENGLLGPTLALYASAGPTNTIEDAIAAFAKPDSMRVTLAGTDFWSGDEAWKSEIQYFPSVVTVLTDLAQNGFTEYWNTRKQPLVEAKVTTLREELSRVDLIGEQQRYVRRALNPEIEVYLSAFSEPHGIRIVGQRFLTSYAYPTRIVKLNAAHEIFHPFLLPTRPETNRIVARLSADPLMKKIDARPDKSDGYGSITALVEEDMVQSLEALVSQALGFGRADMGAYWREQDGGIHVFAAAAFHAMHETGFATRGGDAVTWLDIQTANGTLRGDQFIRHADATIGPSGLQRWLS
jgi:hypothetical protein